MYDGEPHFENAGKNTHNTVLEIIQSTRQSGRIMDIPSGSGAFSRRLVKAGYRVVSADVVKTEDIPGVEFFVADMNEALPLEDSSLDCITCIEGIEHLERPFDFVRECERILNDDGHLIITTPNTSSIRSRWRYFLTGFHNKCKYMLDETAPNPLHHINMFSFPALRYMLHTNGFSISLIRTNRIKAVNWLYLPLALVQYGVTWLNVRRAKPIDVNRELSDAVLGQMTTLPLLLGESMIITATKTGKRPV